MRNDNVAVAEGWLYKERQVGRFFHTKRTLRYLRLRNGMLTSHHDDKSPATWELSVVNCAVEEGDSKYQICIDFPQRGRVSFFADNVEDFLKWKSALERASSCDITHFYELGDVLGSGAYAEVRKAVQKQTGKQCAVKVIKKEFSPQEMVLLLRESDIMLNVHHPHIVQTYDVFDTNEYVYIVLEFMQGGELFDIIASMGHFTEKMASRVVRGMVGGLKYLHDYSVVHLDIKPENILCGSKEYPFGVKLADFGLANFLRESEGGERYLVNNTIVGTVGYVAPEVVRKEPYGPPADMWAVGVILFIMLSGKMPFYGDTDDECLLAIAAGKYSFPPREWKNISDGAKSLVRSLLQLDPNKRLTADACLEHSWLQGTDVPDTNIPNDLSGIHSSRRKFRRAAWVAVTAAKFARMGQQNGVSAV